MRGVFLCFRGQKKIKIFFKNILETALKSYIKWLLYFFFILFEKVEKTGIISTKFSLRCTPSAILGVVAITVGKVDRKIG